VIELLAALALTPWPIGPGPAYRPAAGRPVGVCPERRTFRVHLELFAHRRAIVLPAGIGGCSAATRTRTPTGIVEVAEGARLDLGDFFRIWGQPLSAHRLASFRSRSPVRAYVGGRPVRGPVTSIPLAPGAQIVLELGGYVPPHASFLFPRRPS
jgi:hypothetical protein